MSSVLPPLLLLLPPPPPPLSSPPPHAVTPKASAATRQPEAAIQRDLKEPLLIRVINCGRDPIRRPPHSANSVADDGAECRPTANRGVRCGASPGWACSPAGTARRCARPRRSAPSRS